MIRGKEGEVWLQVYKFPLTQARVPITSLDGVRKILKTVECVRWTNWKVLVEHYTPFLNDDYQQVRKNMDRAVTDSRKGDDLKVKTELKEIWIREKSITG